MTHRAGAFTRVHPPRNGGHGEGYTMRSEPPRRARPRLPESPRAARGRRPAAPAIRVRLLDGGRPFDSRLLIGRRCSSCASRPRGARRRGPGHGGPARVRALPGRTSSSWPCTWKTERGRSTFSSRPTDHVSHRLDPTSAWPTAFRLQARPLYDRHQQARGDRGASGGHGGRSAPRRRHRLRVKPAARKGDAQSLLSGRLRAPLRHSLLPRLPVRPARRRP